MKFSKRNAFKVSPGIEPLERRELLSAARGSLASTSSVGHAKVSAKPVALVHAHTGAHLKGSLARASDPSTATFIDPTAVIRGARAINIGSQDYVGPFASLWAMCEGTIRIGNASNVQDNVSISAFGPNKKVVIGDDAILAHNATVIGPATIGAPGGAPAFVGFNAIIDGATVQPGAMVGSLAKVAPGIVIHTGFNVSPGMYIQTQAEADDPNLGKVTKVTSDDMQFMNDVIHVNTVLAQGYTEQKRQSPSSVWGIGPNPPAPPFNPTSSIPTLAGVPTTMPPFRNRVIGDVRMSNSLAQLSKVMGQDDSIRADEASPFVIGKIARMGNQVTIHGLEYSDLASGHGDTFGSHSVIHGGEDSGRHPEQTTVIGSGVRVGKWDVVFRSTIGDNCVIGPYAYIDGSQLAPGTIVPRGAIIINNQYRGQVQWI